MFSFGGGGGGNNAILPSWTIILPESWDESKPDFKGKIDGLKIEEGEWRGIFAL